MARNHAQFRRSLTRLALVAGAATLAFSAGEALAQRKSASAFVPGSGKLIDYVSDDFEDESWTFIHNHPKSSREQDQAVRYPRGESSNGRWVEGPERGQPDQVELIPTPRGGLAGSRQALLLRTLNSGVPGYNSNDVQQDDLVANVIPRLGTGIPVGERPSFTLRVYLPPYEQWENRSGPHFGIRASTSTNVTEKKGGFFSTTTTTNEPYWPGMWIHHRTGGTKTVNGKKQDASPSAYIAIRANSRGQDYRAMDINQLGWWTFGMSFSPDGMVHYYARPGVEDLTAADHIASETPYSYAAKSFRTYFVNVCNHNNGRSWSTPFVIDDPKVYVVNSQRVENIVARKVQMDERRAASQAEAARRRAEAQAKSEERRLQQQTQQQSQRTSGQQPGRTASRQRSSR
ncbi:MAG: hypothetical protein KF688_15055 [Pirellulales bacterium]|nr:hypothetical protein [Pirellulales bacterium]